MKIEFTEEQIEIKERVRAFAGKELEPIAAAMDRDAHFDESITRKLSDINVMGMMVPKEYGGTANSTVAYAIAIEELARVCAGTSILMAVHNSLGIFPIITWGTEEQKRRYLPEMAKGRILGAFALTEPNAGSDATKVATTAKLSGGSYVLNGTKIFITNGPQADLVIVFATVDPSKKHRGTCAFIVEKKFKGFSIGAIEEKLGIRASKTSELVFEDCEVPKENLLGGEGNGFKIAMATLDCGRIGVAAQALGIAQAALDDSVKFSRERTQFGSKIGKHQFVQFTLAEMATRIEASRLLIYRAAHNKDAGLKYTMEAAMAKMYASETAVWAAERAIQLFGGRGYLEEHQVERHLRDSLITKIYEGTNEIQRIVVANNLGL
jgi:butyryl-CoA dehydrogenase